MGYGISARFGKAGPASGTQVLNPTEAVAGKSSTFYLAGGVGVLRNIIYFFLPEGHAVNLTIMDAECEEYLPAEGYSHEAENKN